MKQQENHSQAAILGLQHLLAMYSGSILPYFDRYLYVWGCNSLTIATQ